MTRKGKTIFLGTESESEICEKAMMLEFLTNAGYPKVWFAKSDDRNSIKVLFESVEEAVDCFEFIKQNS